MRALLVAALLAGCHHAAPARAPSPVVQAAQPTPDRGPGRADVDPAGAPMPLAETVSTTRPCVEPTQDPQPSVPRPTPAPRPRDTFYLLRGPARCVSLPNPVPGSVPGGRRVNAL